MPLSLVGIVAVSQAHSSSVPPFIVAPNKALEMDAPYGAPLSFSLASKNPVINIWISLSITYNLESGR